MLAAQADPARGEAPTAPWKEVLAETWPAAESLTLGPLRLRRGAGGGNRVSAATLEGTLSPDAASLGAAEATMRAWGQAPLFQIWPGQGALDAALAERGYARRDPTALLSVGPPVPEPDLAHPILASALPLAVFDDLWAPGGVGPGRRAVMERAAGPKAYLLGRITDRPAGAAFVARGTQGAMLHALEIAPAFRRQGLGAAMMAAALGWAKRAGAARLAVLVTEANAPALALYQGLGFQRVGGYHYRAQAEGGPEA